MVVSMCWQQSGCCSYTAACVVSRGPRNQHFFTSTCLWPSGESLRAFIPTFNSTSPYVTQHLTVCPGIFVFLCASPYLFRKDGTQFGFMVRLAVSRVRDIASALSGRHFSFGATSIDSLGRLSSSGHRTCFAWPLLRVGASFRWFRLADPQVRDIACALSNRHFSLGATSTGSLGRPSSTGHCARFAWPLLQCRGDFL